MPKREDIKSILVIGAGPIVIGQACEFDYSGTQACKALKEEGYKVILINSNPATIMTDPHIADRTYIEPIHPEIIKDIIDLEKPDALLPTIGGQTGLNAAIQVAKGGFLEKHGVELIGADIKAIEKAEDRDLFKKAMHKIGLETTRSGIAHSIEEAVKIVEALSFPVIIRAAYTLGGTGGSIAYNMQDFKALVDKGLGLSLAHKVIVEESIVGWKEYELEVMRDQKDNVIIVCSIENFDPIGIHTGDSITVAPQQTLTDRQYQDLRNKAIKIIREIGVSTGGSNIQFALHPQSAKVIVIEMNPRVSRSSALASKATGFPIAKIAAKLAVGYTLEEIPNDITRKTPASFEPALDYVVTKIPRFAFEKFKASDPHLGVQMKSVGEVMAIGRTFRESLQKAIRGLEIRRSGFDGHYCSYAEMIKNQLLSASATEIQKKLGKKVLADIEAKLKNHHFKRLGYLKDAFYCGRTIEEIHEITSIDKWFLHHLRTLFELERATWGKTHVDLNQDELTTLKENGFSDHQIALLTGSDEETISKRCRKLGILPVYKMVDTCAAEFEAQTPYFYSTYEQENELKTTADKKIMILGGGPNRIGQGIEFDYMCVQASLAIRESAMKTIMVNSNPETVSTDYDVSDYLFFEPVTFENVMHIITQTKAQGVIVQLGGQTPLNIAMKLHEAGVPLLGTSAKSIAMAEDREQFKECLKDLGIKQPKNAIAFSTQKGMQLAAEIGFPLVVRPSFVLGGRAMQIVYDTQELQSYFDQAVKASPDHPILLDKYLENAVEIDVDGICDGEAFCLCAVMEHVEQAGIHSGDSACVLPAQSISKKSLEEIETKTKAIALKLGVRGFINVQYAIKDAEVYVLEVNPRGSRTIPFVCKTTGIPWVKIATNVMLGQKLSAMKIPTPRLDYVSVKEAVLPFDKFPLEDIILGPEMKSTGEVMGIDSDLGQAYYKAQMAAGQFLPSAGGVLVTVNTKEKLQITEICRKLKALGFHLYSTSGTGKYLKEKQIDTEFVHKVDEGRPDIRDLVLNRKIDLIFNTPIGKEAKTKDESIRLLAKQHKIPIVTTASAMHATVRAIEAHAQNKLSIQAIQSYHQ